MVKTLVRWLGPPVEAPTPRGSEGPAEDTESSMTLQKVTSAVPELGVAMIGSGLMAKSHTMGYRNVESVYGSAHLRPPFALASRFWPTPGKAWRVAARRRWAMTVGRSTGGRL